MLIITRGAEHDELVSVVRGLTAAMQALTLLTMAAAGPHCTDYTYYSPPRCRARATLADP